VISHDKVDLVGESQLEADHVKEQLVGEAAARLVLGPAVDDFLEDDMPVRAVGQGGKSENSLEIATVAVDVARDDQRTGRRQGNQIPPAELVRLIGSNPLIEKIDYCLRHFGSA